MLKIMIVIVIFLICSTIGYIYGESFRKRFIQIKEIYKGIILLQNQIIFNSTPLPDALREVGKKTVDPIKTVLINVGKDLNDGIEGDVYSAFKNNYLKNKEDFYLTKEDISILGDFMKSLGDSGVYGQEKNFKLAEENLRINLEEALESSKKNTKLYRYLGVCLGLMISIFLL